MGPGSRAWLTRSSGNALWSQDTANAGVDIVIEVSGAHVVKERSLVEVAK